MRASLFSLAALVLHCWARLEPVDLLFSSAVEAYQQHDWLAVILNMERALHNHAALRKTRARCRLSCARRSSAGVPGVPGAGPLEELAFFQRVLRRAECVSACEEETLGAATLHQLSASVELEFRKRTPYNYLQVAYFKVNQLDKAVAAANTFFIANPDHVEMKQNLEYYRMMAGVQNSDFKDLEEKPHMAEFLQGKRLYSAEAFTRALGHFEAAVVEYFSAYEECRALCEGAYHHDGYKYMDYNADLFQAVTDHYLHVLSCQQSCSAHLATAEGLATPLEDFLPSHFDYLQFSYYNSGRLAEAIESAKTFLLFHPHDDVMIQNLRYYSTELGEERAANITARELISRHVTQSLLEKELLYFGYEVFGKNFVDPDKWTPEDVMPQKLREKQQTDRETAARITEEIGNLMKEIETLVEEKNKESSDLSVMLKDGGAVSGVALPPAGASEEHVTMTAATVEEQQQKSVSQEEKVEVEKVKQKSVSQEEKMEVEKVKQKSVSQDQAAKNESVKVEVKQKKAKASKKTVKAADPAAKAQKHKSKSKPAEKKTVKAVKKTKAAEEEEQKTRHTDSSSRHKQEL